MNYAVWIAIAVVFIAVAPAILRNLRRDGKSSGDAGSTHTGTSNRDRDNDDSADSDGGGD